MSPRRRLVLPFLSQKGPTARSRGRHLRAPGWPGPGWARRWCVRAPAPPLVCARARGAGPGPLRPRQPGWDTWCLRRPRAWGPAACAAAARAANQAGPRAGDRRVRARTWGAGPRGSEGCAGCAGGCSLPCPRPAGSGSRRWRRRLYFPEPRGAGRGGAWQRRGFPPRRKRPPIPAPHLAQRGSRGRPGLGLESVSRSSLTPVNDYTVPALEMTNH